ncbi:MAG: hypothetical protein A2W20_07200 [Candidatus Aminicenantes bacterium RBG_16_66_30]|nr:MAG: hypothetical protein A2W20_07200 [Candidatus Aminicenantes bacterium RBG_16_66_30]
MLAILAACSLFAVFGLAADQVVGSLWQSAPMTIDGVAQEWETSEPIFDEGSQVQYALRNDGRNLYIIMVFRTPDPASRPRIFPKSTLDYTGMKIYFTTGDKKSKDFGILFQKKQYTADALIANMGKRGQALTEEQKAEIRKKPTHIVFSEEIIKPKKAVAPAESPAESESPMFRAIEKGPLAVCEFRIPLNRVQEMGGLGIGPGQSIMLGFEWGGMTGQILRDMMAGRADQSVNAGDRGVRQDSGFSAGGGGDDGGGEIAGMGGGVGEMGRNPRYKKHAFWIEAKLAAGGN